MLVVDSSALVELLLRTSRGRVVDEQLRAASDGAYSPQLVDLEVAHALRRFERQGLLSPSAAEDALGDFCELSIGREDHAALLPRIWELRHNATAYDAAYLALAEVLEATLVTADRKMLGVPGVRANVELVE